MRKKVFVSFGLVLFFGLIFACVGMVHAQTAGKINVNQATLGDMTKLPGMSEDLAKAILQYRTSNGPFKTTDDLLKVPGMTKETVDAISPKIAFGPAKSQGDDEEVKLPRY